MIRTISVPQGIGDSVWMLAKLAGAGEQFDFRLPGGKPRRGKQIFDLLPTLAHETYYDDTLFYRNVQQHNVTNQRNLWSMIDEPDFALSCNDWLEAGHPLTSWLPDLPITYRLPYDLEPFKPEVNRRFIPQMDKPLIGVYTSAYSTNRHWGFWGEQEWGRLLQAIWEVRPDVQFVFIGAEWDLGLSDAVMKLVKGFGGQYIDTIGKPLGYVIAMMRLLDYGLYFPSGLAIIAGMEGLPGMMWYPETLRLMRQTWRPPDNYDFKEWMMTTPEESFRYLKDEYQLFERL